MKSTTPAVVQNSYLHIPIMAHSQFFQAAACKNSARGYTKSLHVVKTKNWLYSTIKTQMKHSPS